jgi:hypothetical protein
MMISVAGAPGSLARRLLPLQVGVALQGLILWVPIEKLFMTQIGFNAASVGVMAAAYAAVVPLFGGALALTFRTMITSRVVLSVLLLVAAGGLLSQAVFEFGPLWLVEVAAPAVVYGPYWAVLVSTLGVAGLLIGKLDLDRRLLLAVLIILSLATALLLAWTRSLALLMSAQVVLALVLAIISIHASRLLHDAVPSFGQGRCVLRRRDTDLDAVSAVLAAVWLGGG